MILDQHGHPAHPLSDVECSACTHGLLFDEEASSGLEAYEVKKKWPRLDGRCPLGCGFVGIAYASYHHYIAGDW